MAPCLLFFFFFFFFPFITISISSALSFTMKNECQVSTNYKKASAIFIFGDSFFDPGNNNYINTTTLDQANFWPYGQTYFNFPTGRFSDGRLVSDFIAEYAKLPLVPPYMQPGIEKQYYKGVNFASAGAGALTETFQGSVISLDTQLSDYKKVEARLRKDLNDVKAKDILSSAVYLISIGTNDYTSPFLTNSTVLAQYRRSKYVEMVIGNLTTVIKEIYAKGGRKFGLFNLGPLGCFPGLRMLNPRSNGGCFQEPCVIAKLHNKALSKLLTKMEKHLEGFKYSLYDFNSNLIGRMIHPSNYGLKEGKRACCGIGRYRGTFSCGGKRPVKEFELCPNPNEYLFWDSYHLTEKAYEQIAHQMWNEAGLGPYKLKSLFYCL